MPQRRTLPRAEEEAQPERGGHLGLKKRGLGSMGRLAFKSSVPELTLLPHRDLFRPAELSDLCAITPAELRAIEKEFGEHFPDRAVRPRAYTRHQVELLLRIKHLYLEEQLPPEEVRRRLSEPVLRPLPVLPRPRPQQPDPPTAHQAEAPVLTAGAALPSATITLLRGELQAILALCEEPDVPAGSR